MDRLGLTDNKWNGQTQTRPDSIDGNGGHNSIDIVASAHHRDPSK